MVQPPPPDGYPPLPRPDEPIVQECVEGYLFSRPPLAVLVFQRAPARGSIWVPIQGKADPSDPDLEGALRRELREETGLDRPLALFSLDWHVPFRDESGGVWRLHAYGVEVPKGFRPRLNEENVRADWVLPEEAERRLYFPDNRQAVARLVDRLQTSSSNL
jgi:8-oxo-dGTP pyrophosphatase MutT (NUDIX family)